MVEQLHDGQAERVAGCCSRRRGRRCARRTGRPRRASAPRRCRPRGPAATAPRARRWPARRRSRRCRPMRACSSTRAEQRREHDVHAGDEARHRGGRSSAGRRSAAPARRRRRGRAATPLRRSTAVSARHRARRESQTATAAMREADGEEVGDRHALDDVLEQEERRAPDRGDRQQAERATGSSGGPPGGGRWSTWSRGPCHHSGPATMGPCEHEDERPPSGRHGRADPPPARAERPCDVARGGRRRRACRRTPWRSACAGSSRPASSAAGRRCSTRRSTDRATPRWSRCKVTTDADVPELEAAIARAGRASPRCSTSAAPSTTRCGCVFRDSRDLYEATNALRVLPGVVGIETRTVLREVLRR